MFRGFKGARKDKQRKGSTGNDFLGYKTQRKVNAMYLEGNLKE